jgi:hypothetical protein
MCVLVTSSFKLFILAIGVLDDMYATFSDEILLLVILTYRVILRSIFINLMRASLARVFILATQNTTFSF